MPEPTRIGQIVGAHGLRGQVKVEPLTDFWHRFKKGSRLRLKGNWVTVESYSVHKNRPLLKLSGVDTIDAAEALQWEYLDAILEGRPPLKPDEYLTSDLLDCRVVTTDGQDLGEIDEILAMPAHDVIRIGEIMIPAVKQFIKAVDLERKVITLEPIPGLLSPDEAIEDRP